jgi:hypothetical protein
MIDALLRPGETVADLRADFLRNVACDVSGCWFWGGVSDAYGTFRGRPAHCVSWELHAGPIPEGLFILHGCDLAAEKLAPSRGCVNPAHLRPGTPSENARDTARAKRRVEEARRKRYDSELVTIEVKVPRLLFGVMPELHTDAGRRWLSNAAAWEITGEMVRIGRMCSSVRTRLAFDMKHDDLFNDRPLILAKANVALGLSPDECSAKSKGPSLRDGPGPSDLDRKGLLGASVAQESE